MRRPLLALALAGLASAAAAETMSVMESASYPMSDEDSRNSGRQHCSEAAKHTALDRAGSVFEAEMKSERSESGQDEAKLKMRSYFAGVVSSEMVGDRVDVDPQGRATETCTVRIGYDPGTVSAKMREIADAEGLRKQVAAQQSTIASLESRMQQSPQPPLPAAAPVTQVQTAPVLQAPRALVPYTPPPPRPVYAAPVYYAPPPPPPPVPRPVVYYAPPPPPPAPVVYYAPVPAPRPLVLVQAPVHIRVARVVRRLFYWRP